MISIKLTSQERIELKNLHRKCRKDQRKADRIKAIIMLDNGYLAKEVAKVLLLEEDTITNYKKRFIHRQDMESWLDDFEIYNDGKLNRTQELIVKNYVVKNIITSSKKVKAFIKDCFGIDYDKSAVIEVLHRLGFVYKFSKSVPSKCDPVKQAEFKEMYEELEEDLEDDQVILFIDSVHPQHNTKPTKLWVLKGEEKEIKTNSGRKRLNINGAYNPHNQGTIIVEDQTVNGDTTIELFKKIEETYEDKKTIYAILDNASYYKSDAVKTYLANSKIKPIYLPTYSPNLNLIERLWKLLRKLKINTIFYDTLKGFRDAVMGFFENIHLYKEEIQSFVGTKLHLFQAV